MMYQTYRPLGLKCMSAINNVGCKCSDGFGFKFLCRHVPRFPILDMHRGLFTLPNADISQGMYTELPFYTNPTKSVCFVDFRTINVGSK